jgi:tetratricopeptide (TPR) repeat protein
MRFTASLAALMLLVSSAGAVAVTRPVLRMNPEAQSLMSAGLSDIQRGDYTAAIASLNVAARKQGSVSAYFLLGWAHYQRGFKLGSVETADHGDAQAAIDAYAKALAIDPKLAELPDASRLYFSLALCDEALKSYDKALESYKSALRVAPDKPLIPLHAARLRLKMKNEGKALSNLAMALDNARKVGREAALIAVVRRDPSFTLLLADRAAHRLLDIADAARNGTLVAANIDFRGEELRDSVRDTPSRPLPAQDSAVLDKIAAGNLDFKFLHYYNAVADYNNALSINAKKKTLSAEQVAGVYEKIGAAYIKLGSAEKAIHILNQSLQRDPANARARYQLALAYALDGKTATSLRALKECFSSAGDATEMRRLALLSKTDVELAAVRDLPGYPPVAAEAAARLALR